MVAALAPQHEIFVVFSGATYDEMQSSASRVEAEHSRMKGASGNKNGRLGSDRNTTPKLAFDRETEWSVVRESRAVSAANRMHRAKLAHPDISESVMGTKTTRCVNALIKAVHRSKSYVRSRAHLCGYGLLP